MWWAWRWPTAFSMSQQMRRARCELHGSPFSRFDRMDFLRSRGKKGMSTKLVRFITTLSSKSQPGSGAGPASTSSVKWLNTEMTFPWIGSFSSLSSTLNSASNCALKLTDCACPMLSITFIASGGPS